MSPGLALCLFACGVDREHDSPHADATTTSGATTHADSSDGGDTSDTSDTSSGASDPGTTGEQPDASTSTGTFGASSSSTSGASETTGESGDTSTGDVAVCGDGVVQDGEECDDPGDIHCHECVRDRLVFVTSTGVQGDWALSGIDYLCNHLAAQAGLLHDNQPRFKTWASTSDGGPRDRLTHSRGRYVLVNDLVFAASWDDLVAGNLLNPLNIDENGQVHDFPVWTGTLPDGTPVPGASRCSDWTTDDITKYGHYGFSFELDGDWTNLDHPVNPTLCGATRSLYCFESN